MCPQDSYFFFWGHYRKLMQSIFAVFLIGKAGKMAVFAVDEICCSAVPYHGTPA
jgi:hypothetical protein